MRPSFYLLEVSVTPGGARKADEYVYNKEDIDRAPRADLTTTFGADLALTYGETIDLRVHIHNRLTHTIDLRPYITLCVPGFPPLGLDADGAVPLDNATRAADRGIDRLKDRLRRAYDVDATVDVTVDWEAARVPPLVPPLLPASVKVLVDDDLNDDFDDDDEFDDDRHWYGYNDVEFGTHRE